jgi:hypothetical protein
MDEKFNGGSTRGKGKGRDEALFPTSREVMAEQYKVISSFSEEEAAAYAPLLEDFVRIIERIEMREEIEEQAVLWTGKEK